MLKFTIEQMNELADSEKLLVINFAMFASYASNENKALYNCFVENTNLLKFAKEKLKLSDFDADFLYNFFLEKGLKVDQSAKANMLSAIKRNYLAAQTGSKSFIKSFNKQYLLMPRNENRPSDSNLDSNPNSNSYLNYTSDSTIGNITPQYSLKEYLSRLIYECACEMGLAETDLYGIAGDPGEERDRKDASKKQGFASTKKTTAPNVKYNYIDIKGLVNKIKEDHGEGSPVYKSVSKVAKEFSNDGKSLLSNEGVAALSYVLFQYDLLDEYVLFMNISVNENTVPPAHSPVPNSSADVKSVKNLIKFFIAVKNSLDKNWITGSNAMKFEERIENLFSSLTDLSLGLNINTNPFAPKQLNQQLDNLKKEILKNKTKGSKETSPLYKMFNPINIYDLTGGKIDEKLIDKEFANVGYKLEEDVNLDKQASDAEKKATDAKIKALQAKKNDLNRGIKPTV